MLSMMRLMNLGTAGTFPDACSLGPFPEGYVVQGLRVIPVHQIGGSQFAVPDGFYFGACMTQNAVRAVGGSFAAVLSQFIGESFFGSSNLPGIPGGGVVLTPEHDVYFDNNAGVLVPNYLVVSRPIDLPAYHVVADNHFVSFWAAGGNANSTQWLLNVGVLGHMPAARERVR